jgi:copper chaperone
MAELTLKVEGMTCRHCVMRVKKATEQLAGVSKVDVTLGSVKLEYDEAQTGENQIRQAVEKAGYKVTGK